MPALFLHSITGRIFVRSPSIRIVLPPNIIYLESIKSLISLSTHSKAYLKHIGASTHRISLTFFKI
jgi:hypothetical protein